jgi:hypothetical protein
MNLYFNKNNAMIINIKFIRNFNKEVQWGPRYGAPTLLEMITIPKMLSINPSILITFIYLYWQKLSLLVFSGKRRTK